MINNVSSIGNPLGFFEDFFSKGFDNQFGNFFKLTTEEYSEINYPETGHVTLCNPYFMIECNEDEDYIVYVDAARAKGRDDKEHQHKKVLPVELSNILKPELENSLKLTNEAILQKNGEEAIKVFLHVLLSGMAYIIDHNLPLISLPKYIPLCESFLRSYINEVDKRHSYYISREKSTYLKFLSPKNVDVNHSLNMKSEKLKRLDELLKLLKNEEFVEQNLSLELFRKAFDNSPIKEPLGIKWIKIDRGHTYLGGITEMIRQLHDKKYISDYTDAQLSNIFARENGSQINIPSWKSARTNTKAGKNGKRNKILDDIDYIMRNF